MEISTPIRKELFDDVVIPTYFGRGIFWRVFIGSQASPINTRWQNGRAYGEFLFQNQYRDIGCEIIIYSDVTFVGVSYFSQLKSNVPNVRTIVSVKPIGFVCG